MTFALLPGNRITLQCWHVTIAHGSCDGASSGSDGNGFMNT